MPNEIVILLDDQRVDYESREALPFTLVKRTDNILEIVGSEGIEIDNPLESISLPATKTNHSIYDQIALLHSIPGALLVRDTKALADGSLFFTGSAILTKISGGHYPGEMVLEMLGDGLSVWSALEGVSLRDLDLGTLEWTFSTMQTSWVASPPSYPGIFAPVVYGKTSGTFAPGSWHRRDMRLNVYFYNIIQGIFETHLGYTVVSEFFETLWFKRWVYLFGVGDQVQYEDLPTPCSVHVYRIPGVAGTTDPVQFHLEYEDTCNEWDATGGTTFTASLTTTYTLEFTGQGTNWGTFEVEVNGVVVYSTGPSYTVGGGSKYFQIIKQFDLTAGDDLTVHAYTDGGGTLFLYDLHLRIYNTPQPWEGASIVVSSCLHDEPVKKFLRAISQMFCLCWRVNNITRQVFCEPRFPYRLYTGGSYVQYDGFYRHPDDPSTLDEVAATDYDTEFIRPFGKELVMSYAKDESNPLFDTYQAASENSGVPIFGIKKPFSEDEGKSTPSENELFVPLLLCTPDPTHASGGYLPALLPDSYEITEENLPTVEKTFLAKPTCGQVYREAVTALWDDTEEEELMPLISQYKPYRVDGDHDDELNSGIFADMEAQPVDGGSGAQIILGLASTFYRQYFEVMKPATVVTCQQPISLENFPAEDFRDCKRLRLGSGNEMTLGILLEIAGFNPATMDKVTKRFLQWRAPRAREVTDMVHNPVTIAPPRPTGTCCEASATITKDGPDADITVSGCREIKQVEVFVDNAKVYAGDLTAGTFGDATVASDKTITISGSAIGTGVVTFTVNIKQDGCEVKQSVRVLEY